MLIIKGKKSWYTTDTFHLITDDDSTQIYKQCRDLPTVPVPKLHKRNLIPIDVWYEQNQFHIERLISSIKSFTLHSHSTKKYKVYANLDNIEKELVHFIYNSSNTRFKIAKLSV
jgi:hypothetical protein